MLAEAARRLARGIEPRDDLARRVDDLRVGIGAHTRVGVVDAGGRPRGIEGRTLDLVERPGLAEVDVARPGVDERVVALDGAPEAVGGHRAPLVLVVDGRRELLDRVGLVEKPVGVDVRGLHVPSLPLDPVGIEDRPDRTAAVQLAGVPGPLHRGEEVLVVPDSGRLVVEAEPVLLDQDQVLPVPH